MKEYQENLKKDIEINNYIKSTEKSRPYVDPVFGVMWGTNAEKKKETKKDAKLSKA